jgi:two-component sensor histidine kinase/HAMP domain-containing protein
MTRLKYFLNSNNNRTWYKGIFVRTALLSWLLIIIALSSFILGTLPYQLNVIKSRMNSEANDIVSSIGQVAATAIINDDYAFVVDHCLQIIKQSKSILYIIIKREDGFTLVHTANGWYETKMKSSPNDGLYKYPSSIIKFSNVVNEEVYQYSYPFTYSGISWGHIQVGLSLKNYNQNINDLYMRTIGLAVLLIFFGLAASVFFARKLTKPILQLDIVAQKVASGDLTARVNINGENEIGRLAKSFNKMTESLKGSQDNLERKVEERTSELEKINRILHVEIKERLAAEHALRQYNLRLETLDKIYTGIISAKSVEEIVIETINHMPKLFPAADKAAVDIYDIKHNNDLIFLKDFASETKPAGVNNQIQQAGNIKIFSRHIDDDKKPGKQQDEFLKPGLNSIISTPLIIEEKEIGIIRISSLVDNYFNEEQHEVLLILANQLALAVFQAQLQEKIKEHAQNLQSSLSEKEVLLKEIHHRVKNNLQVISSLLYLQSTKAKDEETLHLFEDSQNRIKSMALIHEKLYQSKDLSRIDFYEYVAGLLSHLNSSYQRCGCVIKRNIDVNNIHLSLDTAISCGLIVNELFTNAYKYAFTDEWLKEHPECEPVINIIVTKSAENNYKFIISDNGIGIAPGIDIKNTASLGLKLVNSMVKQLDGTLEINRNNGSAFIIEFTDLK